MKRPVITGATGFIGGRLAEVLCEQGASPVALVRAWSRVARLSRLPVRMVAGDVLDLDSVRRAMKGCDVVFHCAVDWRGGGRANRRSSTVGTRNVLQAAHEAGVSRVVFLSTAAVFGRQRQSGTLREEDPCPRTGEDYADGKIQAEQVALAHFQRYGLPVAVLRPTIVYGPFGTSWTVMTAQAIRDGRMVLVNGGNGICNSLYVDNLVEAMLLAAHHPRAPGEVFNISDAEPVTWRAFVEGHARALGGEYLPLPEMTVEEIEALRVRAARAPRSSLKQSLVVLMHPQTREMLRTIPMATRLEGMVRWTVGRALPGPAQRWVLEMVRSARRQDSAATSREAPRPLLPRSVVQTLAGQATVSVEKARRVLGYTPRIGFDGGMARTTAWIRWAQL